MVTNRSYEYGTSPHKIKPSIKTNNAHKKAKAKAQKEKKQKAVFKLMLVSLSVITFAILLGICYRYSLINQEFKDIQGVKKEYLALQAANDQMEIGIQSQYDLTVIERYAKDKLGMQKADANQIKYLDIEKKDKVELNQNILNNNNVFQNVLDEILKVLD